MAAPSTKNRQNDMLNRSELMMFGERPQPSLNYLGAVI